MGVTTETKICPGCGEDKPAKEFRRRPDRPFGVHSRCQACTDAVPLPAWVGPDEKQCSKCREVKPKSEFGAHAASRDGLYPQCGLCKNTVQAVQAKARAEEREGVPLPDEKRCTGCGVVKPLDDFHRHPTSITGRQSKCKVCKRPIATAVAKANTDRYNAGETLIPEFKTCTLCRETKPSSEFTTRKASKDGLSFRCIECANKTMRDQRIQRSYGISVAERDAMLALQGGCCANCGSSEHRGKNWVVDHDHGCCPGDRTCGNCIAGILCAPCNFAIGLLNDDINLMAKTIEYVKRTRKAYTQSSTG